MNARRGHGRRCAAWATLLTLTTLTPAGLAQGTTAESDDTESSPGGTSTPALPTNADEAAFADPPQGDSPDAAQTAAPQRERVDAELGKTFSDPRYRFCHDASYDPLPTERVLCTYAARGHERCPALRFACATNAAPDVSGPWFSRAIIRVVFWVVVAAGLSALVYFLVRAFATRRAPEAEPKGATPDSVPDSVRTLDSSGPAMDRDAQRLWSMAHQLASAGKYDEAMHHAYAAFLRQLESERLLHIDSTQTNGDLARQLQPKPELQATLRDAARSVEAVQFGVAPPTQALFRQLVAGLRPSLPRALVSLVVLVALVTCVAGCSWMPSRGFSARLDGTNAFRELLEAHADDVEVRRRDVEDIDSSVGTVVVLPGYFPEESERDALIEWTRRGGLLVLASTDGFLVEELEVEAGGHPAPFAPATGCRPHVRAAIEDSVGDLDLAGLPASLSLGPSWLTLLTCADESYAGLRYLGDGAILVLASEDFISNGALAVSDNGHFLMHYLGDPGSVELLDRSSSSTAGSPYLMLENTSLANAIWHVLALVLVFYLWRGIAFGKLRDPVVRGRRSFSEHVEALGLLYRKRGASRMVLAQYGGWLVERMRASVVPGREARLLGLANAVHQRTSHPEAEIVRVLAEVHTAKDDLDSGELAEDFKTIRKLEWLAARMGGPRERR